MRPQVQDFRPTSEEIPQHPAGPVLGNIKFAAKTLMAPLVTLQTTFSALPVPFGSSPHHHPWSPRGNLRLHSKWTTLNSLPQVHWTRCLSFRSCCWLLLLATSLHTH